ncbi:MAG: ABC transporter ATP-binding protein [Deltaproteobacteria bacterium]|nr:MAG: ABC transporter ATP-binding protein [Deltaproteobacteria bacterium]
MFFEVEEIHTFLGKSHILDGVSLKIEKGEFVALLGRNGVGKSTTLKSIIGLARPEKGSIQFKGTEVLGLRSHEICRLGIGYVPEERRIFPHLTVRQNLLIGMKPNQRVDRPWTIEKIYGIFPQLEKRDRQKGGNLSGGEQQMLTIGRTLTGNPELILVDEPMEGLSPLLVEIVAQILRQINEEGGSLLLVEHAIDIALDLAKRAYVMSKGKIVFEGTSQELYADEAVRKKYLEI